MRSAASAAMSRRGAAAAGERRGVRRSLRERLRDEHIDIKRHLIDGTFPGTRSRAWQKQRWKSVDEKLVNRLLLTTRPRILENDSRTWVILRFRFDPWRKTPDRGIRENDSRTWVYAFDFEIPGSILGVKLQTGDTGKRLRNGSTRLILRPGSILGNARFSKKFCEKFTTT